MACRCGRSKSSPTCVLSSFSRAWCWRILAAHPATDPALVETARTAAEAHLAASLPQSMEAGLLAQHVPEAVAHQIANMPPVASLFAAFLGYNPMGELIPANVLHALPQQSIDTLTGHVFFPELMSGPFKHGLVFAFTFSAILYLVAAFASWRGGRTIDTAMPEMLAAEGAGRR